MKIGTMKKSQKLRRLLNMKTITKNGWWSVSFDFDGEVSDDTLNHIADCIKKGFTQGEIIEELEVEEVA